MSRNDRQGTLRRMIQQAGHCIDEARSIVERNEDGRCAVDDLEQAKLLVEKCLADARDWARAQAGR